MVQLFYIILLIVPLLGVSLCHLSYNWRNYGYKRFKAVELFEIDERGVEGSPGNLC